MSAIRLARGFTGRDIILKFEGCYHGHSDGLLVKAGSGALTTGVPDSAGVPADYARNTLTASYNDCDGIEKIFRESGDKIAAVIVEPVAGNMGVVNPDMEFLELLRKVTAARGALLIFDEVITGFRVAYGGAQQLYGIVPDITVLGKIIGGGMPVGAFGGKRDIMSMVSPSGPVYQAGTLSGNPVAMAAGSTVLKILRDNRYIYSELNTKGRILEEAFTDAGRMHGIPLAVNRTGSMLSVFFTDGKVDSYKAAVKSDKNRFVRYFKAMLERGIYVAPSPFEAMFVSHAHSEDDIKTTVDAIYEVFSAI
jgi:glutamate-1-semialdehyde 2,1-aminomutase